jgi:serine O-acetyltransferase
MTNRAALPLKKAAEGKSSKRGTWPANPAITVYPWAVAEQQFPGVITPNADQTPSLVTARLHALAAAVQQRSPGSHQVILVYRPSGAALGLTPVGDDLVGFSLPAANPHSQENVGDELLAFAARLARATSHEEVRRLISNRRPGHPPQVIDSISAAAPNVVPTRVDEPDTIIGRLIATYYDPRYRHIQVSGTVPPPQLREVERFIDLVFPLLFPGFHGPLPSDPDFDAFACRRASVIQSRLSRLIRHAMAFAHAGDEHGEPSPNDFRETAERAVVRLFDNLPRIRQILDHDVQAAYLNDPALKDSEKPLAPLAYPGLIAVSIQRLAHLLLSEGVPFIPRMMTEIAHARTGIDIHPGARIGHGFFIDHGTGVVIGETTIIGNGVTLYQGVTLGARNFPQDEEGKMSRGPAIKRHPTIGSGTTIYANASVLGDIEVGPGCTIGANVSLRDDLKAESTARLDRALRKLVITCLSNQSSDSAEEIGQKVDDIMNDHGDVGLDLFIGDRGDFGIETS